MSCLRIRVRRNRAMEEHYAARELAAAIERFLDTQSKENRVLFMRRYWYADSFAEIGKLLGITEGIACWGEARNVSSSSMHIS